MSETAWLMFRRKNKELIDAYCNAENEDEKIKLLNEMNSRWADFKEDMT